jgi:hypothetical protein
MKGTDMPREKHKMTPEHREKYRQKPVLAKPIAVAVQDKQLVSLTRKVMQQLSMPNAVPSVIIMAALVEARAFIK